jgi:transposase-like protein
VRRSAGFKECALERMKRSEDVKALARELGVPRSTLYLWRNQAKRRLQPTEPGAVEDPRDHRIRELVEKVGELEAVIGRKTLELDFFAGALRRIGATRQRRSISGEKASTRKSAEGCNRKAD